MYQVTFLHHSGILIETEHYHLLFDYDIDPQKPNLFLPKKENNKQLFIFVSHSHSDHFNPTIFEWSKAIPHIHYILSYDVPAPEYLSKDIVTYAKPHESYQINDIQISTLLSNDEGVAFLVKADGKTFFHAGDLNWWHWNGESDAFNQDIAHSYQSEILRLQDESIDAAFIPADPRLEENFVLAIDFFSKTVKSSYILPIHFWGEFSVCKKISDLLADRKQHCTIVQIENNGEKFYFE